MVLMCILVTVPHWDNTLVLFSARVQSNNIIDIDIDIGSYLILSEKPIISMACHRAHLYM